MNLSTWVERYCLSDLQSWRREVLDYIERNGRVPAVPLTGGRRQGKRMLQQWREALHLKRDIV